MILKKIIPFMIQLNIFRKSHGQHLYHIILNAALPAGALSGLLTACVTRPIVSWTLTKETSHNPPCPFGCKSLSLQSEYF